MSELRKPKFAVFDIDGTLLRWQFFHAVVHELGKTGAIDAEAHKAINDARMAWKTRKHSESFAAYEKTLVNAYLGALENIAESEHSAAVERVFDEYKDQLFTYTRKLLQNCQDEGRLIFVVSGSHELILAKLAEQLGIDDYIGANFEFTDGKYSGISRTPVHDKAAALNQLVNKHNATFADSIAIGDSESDIAMLELVERPIAFNPSHGLYEVATKQGWKIVLERKNMIYELEPTDGRYVLNQT